MIIIKEKYSLISDLRRKDKELVGDKKLAMIGVGDFPGMNNTMRATMNVKHISQHLTIDNPEFPYIFNGNENVMGANSSFYNRVNKEYKVIKVIKKYNELLKGKVYFGLYFLHCEEDDSYYLVERKECENLTEDFGFDYRNEYLDNAVEGDIIPQDTVLYTPSSYDDDMNVSTGVNARILYATDPAVQDDAIVISESFAKRMISNQITSKTIPVNENTVFVNLHGDKDNYQGLPNIGDIVEDGIIAATRQVKETRMFSDLRDSSLTTPNFPGDQIFHGDGEIIDINVYCNNPNIKINRVNAQLIQYWNDLKFFYSEIYRICRKIINSGSKSISREINYWLRRSMEYLDSEAKWDFNDNVFSNLMIQILIRKKEPILVGRKLTGRAGNKSIVSKIVPDEEMPYVTSESWTDEYGRVHAVGEKQRVEVITNPLAIINRTIPSVLFEASITFVLTRIREHMARLNSLEEQANVLFRILELFNKTQAKDNRKLYKDLSDRAKKEYIKSAIEDGIYVQKKAFDEEQLIRDALIQIYEEFEGVVLPYSLFVPKKKWNRDVFVGKFSIGYQYIMLLKQSGEKGFSVRAAGAISDESLPEKSNENKIGKEWHSSTPIRFGEWTQPKFNIA